MNRKAIPYFVPLLLFAVFIFISLHFPFFWDTILYSHIADWYLQTGFSSLVPPQILDTGNQPFFELLLALCWKIFGHSLLISHLITVPFVAGIILQFYRLAKRLLPHEIIPFAVFFLLIEPTFLAQSGMVSLDIIIVFFYLLGLNSILKSDNKLLLIATIGLSLTNLRGTCLIAALLLTEIVLNSSKNIFRKFPVYLPALFIFSGWLVYHYLKTNWFFMQPNEWAEHREILSLKGMLKNIFIIAWHFFDFGRFAFWIFLIAAIWKRLAKKQLDGREKSLIKIIVCPLLVMILVCVPFSNPIGHRYFMITNILLAMLLAYEIQFVFSKIRKIVLCLLFVVAITAGHFIIYPAPYSNGWDSSLTHLYYFPVRDKMTGYIIAHSIKPSEVGADFPCNASYRYTNLEGETEFANKYFGGISAYRYVLQSNINNKFSPGELSALKNSWEMIIEYKSGPVYMRLYRNPAFAGQQ